MRLTGSSHPTSLGHTEGCGLREKRFKIITKFVAVSSDLGSLMDSETSDMIYEGSGGSKRMTAATGHTAHPSFPFCQSTFSRVLFSRGTHSPLT